MTCVQCPNGTANLWKYLIAAFLPLTVFYFTVLLFKINANSSNLHGFVFYSQIISVPIGTRIVLISLRQRPMLQTVMRIVAAFYGVWNLDFFRSLDLHICLGTDTLLTLALDIVVGVYPFLLMVLTYLLIELHDRNFRPLVIMWKPFGLLFSKLHNIKTSLIDSFATFILLANYKLLSISFDLLIPVRVYHLNSSEAHFTTLNLFYDATLPYFGQRHLPYAILAIAVLVVFTLIPTLLVILYPLCGFQKFLNLFPVRWYILHTFMDSFQGCYKNGTEPGTRDCRWFASIYFLSRLVLMCIYASTFNFAYFSFAAVMLSLMSLMFKVVQPYKRSMSIYTDINVSLILLLALWYISIIGILKSDETSSQVLMLYALIAVISGTLPLLYITYIILHWFYSHRTLHMLIARLFAWRNGYEILE